MFVTELPVDEYGNRAHTAGQAQVIEVEPEEDGFGVSYRVIAPDTFIKHWPSVNPSVYPFVEVAGPVRLLTEKEYVEVLAGANVAPMYLERARAAIG